MKKFLIPLICTMFAAMPVYAENSTADLLRFQKELATLNRIKPLQNPRYESAQDVLGGRVLDSTNKVVGELHDVLIGREGGIASLLVSFDRLRLGTDVYLNYVSLGIQNVTNGYRLGFNDDEINEIYPELLANIESAAGDDDMYSLKDILNKPVKTDDNRTIGSVETVFFDKEEDFVRSVYLHIKYQNIREHGVAIPLSALDIKNTNGRLSVTIDHDMADQIFDYIQGS